MAQQKYDSKTFLDRVTMSIYTLDKCRARTGLSPMLMRYSEGDQTSGRGSRDTVRISEAGEDQRESVSIRISRETSKMPRKRELENNLLGILKVGKQKIVASPVALSYLSGELFSGICRVPLCLCNSRTFIRVERSVTLHRNPP